MGNNASSKRTIDGLGRVVLPKDVRDQLNLKENDEVIIQIENGKATLTPIKQAHCVLCNSVDEIACFEDGYIVCKTCLKAMIDEKKGKE